MILEFGFCFFKGKKKNLSKEINLKVELIATIRKLVFGLVWSAGIK